MSENINKDLTGLRYSIPQRDLKTLGYKMLHNKRGYTLDIKEYACTIWIWLAGKTIYVNDWYDRSYDVIEFYKANRDAEEYLNDEFLIINYNFVSGFIDVHSEKALDDIFKFSLFGKSSKQKSEEWREKYKDCNRVYLKKEYMDKLIIELEKLKPLQIYAGTPVSK